MTDAELDALEALAAKATPGPWQGERMDDANYGACYVITGRPDAVVACVACNSPDCHTMSDEDEAFIVAARTAVPWLVTVARLTTAALGRARLAQYQQCLMILHMRVPDPESATAPPYDRGWRAGYEAAVATLATYGPGDAEFERARRELGGTP